VATDLVVGMACRLMSPLAHSTAEIALFVYGTLLRGEVNHAELTDCRFAGEARSEPFFTLLDLGPYPVMVRGGATFVKGEVYWVPAAVLRSLDRFEGHPTLYERARIRLAPPWGLTVACLLAEADAYLAPEAAPRGRQIADGDWRRRGRSDEPA